jgi:hypothetical protein
VLEKNIIFNSTGSHPINTLDGSNIKISVRVIDMVGEAVTASVLKRDQVIESV